MRTLAALVLVNLLFVAANLAAAGTILALGILVADSPSLANPWAWAAIVMTGVGASLLAVKLLLFSARALAAARGRGPA